MTITAAILIVILGQAEAPLRLDGAKKTAPVKLVVEHLDVSTPGGTTEKKEFRTTLEATLALEQDAKGPRVAVTLQRLAKVNEGVKTDSASADSSPGVTLFKLFCNTPIGLRPGAAKADDLEGLSDLVANAAKGAGAPPNAVPRLKDWLGGMILQDVVPFVFFHPARPQKVGGTWSVPLTGTTPDYPLVGEAGWTLGSRKEGRTVIKLKSAVKSSPQGKPDGAGITRELAGTLEGTMDVDDASGWILNAAAERKLTGKTALTGLKAPLPSDVWSIDSRSTWVIGPAR